MSLETVLPIPDKWKVKDVVAYKVYELDPDRTLHSVVWATGNEFFIGQSYRDYGKYDVASFSKPFTQYETGWHTFVTIKSAWQWLKLIADTLEDRYENFVIVKVEMREPVAYGVNDLGSRTIVFKYKTLIEEVSYEH